MFKEVLEGISLVLEKSGSSFAVLALVAIIFAFMAFLLFKNAEARQREKIFIITTGFFLTLILVVLAAGIFKGREATAKEIENNPALANSSTLGAHVTVDATAGFQNSGIYLKEGEKAILKTEGRIHLASTQLNTFLRLARPLIAQNLNEKEYRDEKDRFKLPRLDGENMFRRDWTGPEGEQIESDFQLDDCKLRTDLNWGTLLVVIMPSASKRFANSDPFQVLKDNNLKPANLTPIDDIPKEGFVAERDGWLTFIVNDAVISDRSESKVSRDYADALKATATDLRNKGDDRHKLPRSAALVWYSDNVGAFRVTVNKVRS